MEGREFWIWKKWALAAIIISFICFDNISAQHREEVIIKYKNRTIIGTIVTENFQSIVFRTATLDSLVLEKLYIQSLVVKPRNVQLLEDGRFHYVKGIFFGGNFGSGDQIANTTLYMGYRIKRRLSLAMGVTFNNISSTSTNINLHQTFVTPHIMGRYYLVESRLRPFVSASFGYGNVSDISSSVASKGGLYAMPNLGIQLATYKKSRMTFSIGQLFQYTSGNRVLWSRRQDNPTVKFENWYNRFVFKIGIEWF